MSQPHPRPLDAAILLLLLSADVRSSDDVTALGRYSELPSEDPLHAGIYASEMLQGMQEEDANGHPKMIALVKHLTAYSQETGEHQNQKGPSLRTENLLEDTAMGGVVPPLS